MDNLGKIGRSLMDNWGKIRQSLIFYFVAIDDWRLPIQEQSRNLYSPGAQVPQRVIKNF
jgi:hypothetical protein